jgi:hypothetical protein
MSTDRRPTPDEIMKALPERLRQQIERDEQRDQADREARRVDLDAALRSLRASTEREQIDRAKDWDQATAARIKAEQAVTIARDAEHRAKMRVFNFGLSTDHQVNKLIGQIIELADPKWLAFRDELDALEALMHETGIESHPETREQESVRAQSNGVVRKLVRIFSNRRSVLGRYAAIRDAQHAVQRGMLTVGIDVDAEIARLRASIPAIGPTEIVFETEDAKRERLRKTGAA